jgi:hypothetical protein
VHHRHLLSAWDDLVLLLLLHLQGPFWAPQLDHQAVAGEHVGVGVAVQHRTAPAAAAAEVQLHAELGRQQLVLLLLVVLPHPAAAAAEAFEAAAAILQLQQQLAVRRLVVCLQACLTALAASYP